mmetsp:Transcript_10991/g.19420  ORF Transcript_10991/g.19420 Transcript_10991/m.19420 type:complete len:228 (+) Transcript_10991:156-839(+)
MIWPSGPTTLMILMSFFFVRLLSLFIVSERVRLRLDVPWFIEGMALRLRCKNPFTISWALPAFALANWAKTPSSAPLASSCFIRLSVFMRCFSSAKRIALFSRSRCSSTARLARCSEALKRTNLIKKLSGSIDEPLSAYRDTIRWNSPRTRSKSVWSSERCLEAFTSKPVMIFTKRSFFAPFSFDFSSSFRIERTAEASWLSSVMVSLKLISAAAAEAGRSSFKSSG